MKQMMTILVLAVATSSLALSQTVNNNRSGNSEQEILKVRDEWYDAYFRGDTAMMKRIETSDFVVISDRGIQNKREYEALEKAVKENRWMPKGTTKVDDEVNVRVQGEMAVISGRGWNKVPGRIEKPPEKKTAFTEVWVKRDGRWQVMHLHFNQM